MAAAVIAGSAVGVAALPAAQAETSASPAAVIAPASAPNGILGSFSAIPPSMPLSTLYALLLVDDTLYIGGTFTPNSGFDDTNLMAYSLADDTWANLTASPSTFGSCLSPTSVNALAFVDDTLYVGGYFLDIDGVANTNSIAALNNGQWHSVGNGYQNIGNPTTCGSISAISPSSSGVFATGGFSSYSSAGYGMGGVPNTYYIAEWTSADDTWHAMDSGLLNFGKATALKDDTLFVGGAFTGTRSGGPADGSGAIQWSTTGSSWAGMANTSTYPSNAVNAIEAGISDLYVGGDFTARGGVAALHVAQWSYADDTWSRLGPGITDSNSSVDSVFTLAVDDTHSLVYAGGPFRAIGGQADGTLNRMGAWDIGIEEWIPLQYASGANGIGNPLTTTDGVWDVIVDDSTVIIAGRFSNAGGVAAADNLARWTWDPPQGSVDDTYTGSNLPVSGEGFVGVASTGAVTLDDTITPTTYSVAGYTVDDSATITLTNLTGVPQGTYEIHVEGVGGEGSIGTLRVNTTTVPSAPQTPAASAGNASATVTWTAPASTGGAAITQYDVTSSPGGLTCSATPPTTSCVVTGLTNGTAYTFDITATNSVGPSAAATTASVTPVNPTPPTPPTPTKPGAPTNVSGTPGDGQVSVTWQAPADSGTYAVTDYQVTASPGGATCIATAPTLTCTVTGLTNGTAYTFTVKALSGAGWGPDSAPSAAVTPQAPRNPTIMITGSRSPDNDKRVYADGITTDLVGEQVQARVHLAGEEEYQDGSRRTVNEDGTFRWTRKTNKKVYLYFRHNDTRSNRIVIEPR